MTMDLPLPDPDAVVAHARPMAQRFKRAAWASMGFIALLAWIKVFEHWSGQPFDGLALRPHVVAGLIGILTAPLLHASLEHLVANSLPLLILGTLAGGLYPRATLRALPLIWIGSGVGVWFTGEPGSAHIGASGIAHGLMFLVFSLGVLRRDRQAIAAGMMAFFLYGGMLLTIFPREVNISWESHLYGAICGVIAAILWRKRDPALPRKRYSWEDEPDEETVDDEPGSGDRRIAHVDALSHELPRGTAEETWIDNDWDGALDDADIPEWDDAADADPAARPRRRRPRSIRHSGD
jgi:membrane associated rhomboid family serine protease